MNAQGAPSPTPAQALRTTRLLWAALLAGQVLFLVVILTLRASQQAVENESASIVAYVAIAMLLGVAPIAFIIRNALYGTRDHRGTVPPQRYITANIVFLALFEGASFLGLVAFMLGEPLGLIAAGLAMAIQALSFPTGSVLATDNS